MIKMDNCSTTEDEFQTSVAFSRCDGSEYVLFSISKSVDEQDIELGLDGIYLEINDQGCSDYDVIQSLQLDDGTITIELKATFYQKFPHLGPEIVIVMSDDYKLGSDTSLVTLEKMAKSQGLLK